MQIYTDGSPGPKKGEWSGWGAAAYIGDTCVRRACGIFRGKVTTNAAELEGLIRGIGMAADASAQSVIWTDSQYVMNSWNNLIRLHHAGFQEKGVKIPNADRLELIYDLLYEFEYASLLDLRWIRGHTKIAGNEEADRLSKLAAYKGEMFDEKV
jgi:ribonuclease HI